MRPYRLRLGAIAGWLGVIALSLNALVPIHLAFDLADALEHDGHHLAHAVEPNLERCVLALLTGHREAVDKSHSDRGHHHAECPVCGAIVTLAGFAPTAAVLLPLPVRVAAPKLAVVLKCEPHSAPSAAYQSRAPPIASADVTI